jgi:hypothetical protein
MRSTGIPSCCAVNLIVDFGHTRAAIYGENHTKKQIQSYLKKTFNNDRRIQMILLNNEQLKSIGRDTFKELNFKIRPMGLFTGHGNKIYLLTRNPNEQK